MTDIPEWARTIAVCEKDLAQTRKELEAARNKYNAAERALDTARDARREIMELIRARAAAAVGGRINELGCFEELPR